MMSQKLSVKQKKWWVIVHLTFMILWFSGLLGTILLAALTTSMTNRELVYAAHSFIESFDHFLVIPGAIGCLLTGIWMSIRTNWGLTKYYWIIIKLIGNIGVILVGSTIIRSLIIQTNTLSTANQVNPLQNPAYIDARQMFILGSTTLLTVLFFLVIVSIIKPWGKRKGENRNQVSDKIRTD